MYTMYMLNVYNIDTKHAYSVFFQCTHGMYMVIVYVEGILSVYRLNRYADKAISIRT